MKVDTKLLKQIKEKDKELYDQVVALLDALDATPKRCGDVPEMLIAKVMCSIYNDDPTTTDKASIKYTPRPR